MAAIRELAEEERLAINRGDWDAVVRCLEQVREIYRSLPLSARGEAAREIIRTRQVNHLGITLLLGQVRHALEQLRAAGADHEQGNRTESNTAPGAEQ